VCRQEKEQRGFSQATFLENNYHDKISIQQEADSFHQQTGLKFKEETSETIRAELVMVLKLGHFVM
jgi:hypothetical protein